LLPSGPRIVARGSVAAALIHPRLTSADDDDPLATLYDDIDPPDNLPEAHDREDILEDLEDHVLVLSAPHVPPGFPGGSHAPLPSAAALVGEDLVKLLTTAPPPDIPVLALKGMVSSTHAEHRRILKRLTDLPEDCRRRELPTAIVTYLTRLRAERGWRFSSLLKQLAATQGALVNLPLYRHTSVSIQLGTSAVWRQALRAAGRAARTEQPQQPKAIAWAQVQQALHQEPSAVIFSAVLLAWISCARIGC
jgi:hypothetical protein